jgi:hypothetical protein
VGLLLAVAMVQVRADLVLVLAPRPMCLQPV